MLNLCFCTSNTYVVQKVSIRSIRKQSIHVPVVPRTRICTGWNYLLYSLRSIVLDLGYKYRLESSLKSYREKNYKTIKNLQITKIFTNYYF